MDKLEDKLEMSLWPQWMKQIETGTKPKESTTVDKLEDKLQMSLWPQWMKQTETGTKPKESTTVVTSEPDKVEKQMEPTTDKESTKS